MLSSVYTALIASLPILLSVFLMAGLIWPAKKAMPLSWALAAFLALSVWKVDVVRVLAASMEGLWKLSIFWLLFLALSFC